MAMLTTSNWYIIVYHKKAKKNLVLPAAWISGIGDHEEKFLNFGINSAQRFLCFYTNNTAAFDENNCPRTDWEPNFNLKIQCDLQGDGCFIGKLKQCKKTREDAIKYINTHRNIEPAVYNKKRLLEQPVPLLPNESFEGDVSIGDSDNTFVENDELDGEQDNTFDKYETEAIQADDLSLTLVSTSFDAIATDPLEEVEEVKPEPMYDIYLANNEEITSQLDEPIEIRYDDELTMYVGSRGFGKPLKTMIDGRIKRENDLVSGEKPYFESKNGRVYKIGDKLMEIPFTIILKFIDWNKPPTNEDVSIDKRFVSTLFLALVPPGNLADHIISEDIMEFVTDLLKLRCQNMEERMDAIADYKNQICEKMRLNKCDK